MRRSVNDNLSLRGIAVLESTYTIGEERITPSYNTWLVRQSKLYTWESQRGRERGKAVMWIHAYQEQIYLYRHHFQMCWCLIVCERERKSVCVCLWVCDITFFWVECLFFAICGSPLIYVCVREHRPQTLFFWEPPAVHVSDRPVTHSPDGCNAAISL